MVSSIRVDQGSLIFSFMPRSRCSGTARSRLRFGRAGSVALMQRARVGGNGPGRSLLAIPASRPGRRLPSAPNGQSRSARRHSLGSSIGFAGWQALVIEYSPSLAPASRATLTVETPGETPEYPHRSPVSPSPCNHLSKSLFPHPTTRSLPKGRHRRPARSHLEKTLLRRRSRRVFTPRLAASRAPFLHSHDAPPSPTANQSDPVKSLPCPLSLGISCCQSAGPSLLISLF